MIFYVIYQQLLMYLLVIFSCVIHPHTSNIYFSSSVPSIPQVKYLRKEGKYIKVGLKKSLPIKI